LRYGRVSKEVACDGKNRIQPELKRITYNTFISRPKTRTTPKTAPPLMEVTNNAYMQISMMIHDSLDFPDF
jgi:hypothetical protein